MTRKLDRQRFAAGGLGTAILDSAHALVITLDIEGRITGFNRACELLSGYGADEVIGTRFWDRLLPEKDVGPIRQLFDALMQGSEILDEYESAWVTKDGRRPIIAWNNSVVRNAAGEIELVVGIGVDITERKANSDRLARAQQTAKIGSWERDIATGQEYWSDQMYRNLGLEPGSVEARADNYNEYIHPDDHEGVQRTIQDAISAKKAYGTDFRVVWPDGTERLVHEKGEVLLGGSGEIVGLTGTMQDVTELRASENQLQRLATRLEYAQRVARIGNWEWDAATNRQWWSDECYRLLGYLPGEIEATDENFFAIIHPDDLSRARTDIDTAEKNGEVYELTCRVILRDGTERVVREVGYPAYNDNGKYVGQNGTLQDITERKAVENKLRETGENLKKSERIAKLGSWVWEIEEDKEWWSDEIHRIVGSRPEPAVVSGRDYLEYVHPDDRERVSAALDQSLREKVPYIAEYRIRHTDGHEIIIAEHAETEFDKAGRPVRMRGITQDITERKQIEQQLARLNAELEQRVEERTAELRAAQGELVKSERLSTLGQLTATVSHELRNPLGAMRTSMYVVEKKTDADDQRLRAAIGRVNRNITRCDQIIDELLDYTRIRDLNIQQTNIDNWLGAVLSEQPVPGGVEVTRKFRADGPRIPADSDRLRRAVINIFENACQAVTAAQQNEALPHAPKVTVETRLKKDRLEILITDNGPGVPADIREKIFEPLFSTKNFGVGLGLPTVKQIMEQHGGGVEIGDRRGGGAKFALWLPLAGKLEIADS